MFLLPLMSPKLLIELITYEPDTGKMYGDCILDKPRSKIPMNPDRATKPTEIEITPKMIGAGVAVLWGNSFREYSLPELSKSIEDVYRAMFVASHRKPSMSAQGLEMKKAPLSEDAFLVCMGGACR